MGCLELDHGHEGLFGVGGLLEPGESFFGDEVVAVAFKALTLIVHLNEVGVVVGALAGKDFPVVEADGVGVEGPFADHGGGVAGVAKEIGEGLLEAVEVG